MPSILIVDDEPDICEILRFNFDRINFEVSTASSAEEALHLIDTDTRFDIMLLDVMMDSMSGFELASLLRTRGINTPIIFLTALADEAHQLEGFSRGADDYIYKPFSFATVQARVAAVLRRSISTAAKSPSETVSATLTYGNLRLLPDKESVYLANTRLQLTKKEYQILHLLLANRGTHFSREQIMAAVWGNEVCVGDRSVDVHIARLRRKLGPEASHIVNRSGFGYAFV